MMLGQRGSADQKLNWLLGCGFGEEMPCWKDARSQTISRRWWSLVATCVDCSWRSRYCEYCMVFDEFSIPSGETATTTPKEWYMCTNNAKPHCFLWNQQQYYVWSGLDTKHGPITVCISGNNMQMHGEWFTWHFLQSYVSWCCCFSHTHWGNGLFWMFAQCWWLL